MRERAQLLFVYGTLLDEAEHPMASVLQRHAKRVGRAYFKGQLFDIGDYPGAVPSQNASDRVLGELYEIETGSEAAVFEELDKYEDCDPEDPSAGEFVRVRSQVMPEAGDPVEAWIYQYNRPTTPLERIASGDYRDPLRGRRKLRS